ncbi:ATP-binding protein [Lacibacter sp. H375]|uniref:ATP-binding protein n=1 Tax=Lacibacter sp. H375 TaxID=3133424 RepID=UPI0030C2D09A
MLYTLHKNIHTSSLDSALSDLRIIISQRIQAHFNEQLFPFHQWLAQQFNGELYNEEIGKHIPHLQHPDEWIILMLALVPHVSPNFFESIIQEQLPGGGDFAEFGGVKATNHRSMLPTGETVQFVLAGTSVEDRLKVQFYFSEDHFFFRESILWLEPVKEGEPVMSGRIILAQDVVDKILLGRESAPRFGLDFPAKRITTQMNWNDLVLPNKTSQQVADIVTWLKHHHKISADENLKRKIKPGYRVLFYGPSGTGKTLTAGLIGKQFEKEVYRIDLSQVVSKYIGETEKNLESVFKRAESKDWILFFDEADALFGKRTNVQSSHDKYANQEISYLLQRVEDYPGLMILASNFRHNLDDAFVRRFHAVIHFPIPNAHERYVLWQKSLPDSLTSNGSVDLYQLADKYELTGASILNAVQFAVLQCYARNTTELQQADLLDGIRKELMKEEKSA